MERKRFYFEKQNLKNNQIVLNSDEFHHMINVMRLREGDSVVLFCGDGMDYNCTIEEIKKKEAILKVEGIVKNNTEINSNIVVFQALAKGEKLSLIAQKLTEIGISEMCVFESKFCDVKTNTSRLDKLNKVVISASKQCGRSTIMKINDKPITFNDLLNRIKEFDVCYIAYENETKQTLAENMLARKTIKSAAVIIGPEGGFAKEEVGKIVEAGAVSVSLGARILRTETAAIYSASIISGLLEKLQK